MTVDMRPPSPGTATSALWSSPKRIRRAKPSVMNRATESPAGARRQADVASSATRVRGSLTAARRPLEGDRVALREAAPRARHRAPARPALERRGGDPARAAHARDARVEPQAGDHGVGVARVREDRDPGALPLAAPAHERAGVERRLQQPGAVEGERDGAGAVGALGDVELQVVAAAVAVRQLLERVGGPDRLLDLLG